MTLNVLLSFSQFEREVIGERIRDKIAASKQKGMWLRRIADHPASRLNELFPGTGSNLKSPPLQPN